MSTRLKIYDRPSSREFTDVLVKNDMLISEIIPLLRVQSRSEKSNKYGLILHSEHGMCTWLRDNSRFGTIIVDSTDKLFIQPLEKIMNVTLPDGRHVQMTLNQRHPVEKVVEFICRHFEIVPDILWGAYMFTRNEYVLLLPDLSISEQAPELHDIYLRQYLFPKLYDSKYLKPMLLYLYQYRKMAISHEFYLHRSDESTLKRYNWFVEGDNNLDIPKTADSQEEEFQMFIKLKSFGEIMYKVRFHQADDKGQHSQEFQMIVTLSHSSIAVFKEGDDEVQDSKYLRPYSSIKCIGKYYDQLKIVFDTNDEWYITNHRAYEIGLIIRRLMSKISLVQPIKGTHPALVPMSTIIATPKLYEPPKRSISCETIMQNATETFIQTYVSMAKKKFNDELDSDYSTEYLQLQVCLEKMRSCIRSCDKFDREIIEKVDECNKASQSINGPTPRINRMFHFQFIEQSLRRLNYLVFGNQIDDKLLAKYRKNEKIMNAIHAKIERAIHSHEKTKKKATDVALHFGATLLKIAESENPDEEIGLWQSLNALPRAIKVETREDKKAAAAIIGLKASLNEAVQALQTNPQEARESLIQMASVLSTVSSRPKLLQREVTQTAAKIKIYDENDEELIIENDFINTANHINQPQQLPLGTPASINFDQNILNQMMMQQKSLLNNQANSNALLGSTSANSTNASNPQSAGLSQQMKSMNLNIPNETIGTTTIQAPKVEDENKIPVFPLAGQSLNIESSLANMANQQQSNHEMSNSDQAEENSDDENEQQQIRVSHKKKRDSDQSKKSSVQFMPKKNRFPRYAHDHSSASSEEEEYSNRRKRQARKKKSHAHRRWESDSGTESSSDDFYHRKRDRRDNVQTSQSTQMSSRQDIPVPQFYYPTMYSPSFFQPPPSFYTPPSSPNPTHVESSPKIYLNLGDKKSKKQHSSSSSESSEDMRMRKKKSKKPSKFGKIEFSSSDSDPYEKPMSTQDIITEIEISLDEAVQSISKGQGIPSTKVGVLRNLSEQLKMAPDVQNTAIPELIARIDTFCSDKRNKSKKELLEQSDKIFDLIECNRAPKHKHNTNNSRTHKKMVFQNEVPVISTNQTRVPGSQPNDMAVDALNQLQMSLTQVQQNIIKKTAA